MEITLSKALKLKAKLIKQVEEAYQRFSKNNSCYVGTVPTYDPANQLKEWKFLSKTLNDLKTAICKANGPIQEKIFWMGELKNQIFKLRGVSCTSGEVVAENWRSNKVETKEYSVFLSEVERDELVASLESELDSLQEQLDHFNITTKINVDIN